MQLYGIEPELEYCVHLQDWEIEEGCIGTEELDAITDAITEDDE